MVKQCTYKIKKAICEDIKTETKNNEKSTTKQKKDEHGVKICQMPNMSTIL